MRRKRTRGQIIYDVLESLDWGMRHFDGYRPRDGTEKKYMLVAVELGLAESIGFCQKCDGDGFLIENSVEKEAWRMTEAGVAVLKQLRGGDDEPMVLGYPDKELVTDENLKKMVAEQGGSA